MMLRISALFIAVIAAIGLWKKAWLPEKKCFRAGFFVYYTHLSNLFILVYELVLGASGHDPDGGAYRWLSSPGVAVSVTLCIYVTHLIYAFVLIHVDRLRTDWKCCMVCDNIWNKPCAYNFYNTACRSLG